MIDTSKAKWDLSREEKYVIRWLNENGFSGTLEKQYLSKTHFTLTKNGVNDSLSLPQGIEHMNIKGYMEGYGKSFELLCELMELRKKAGEIK